MSNDNDDLIIDLTDLMDEEDPAKKPAPEKPKTEEKTLKIEAETFDLGRELLNDDQPENKSKEEFDFDKVFRESLDGIAAAAKQEPKPSPKNDEHEFPFEEKPDEVMAEKPLEDKVEQEFEHRPEQSAKPEFEKAGIEAAIEYLKKDIPDMVESIVRPVVSELVNEIASSVKRDLPGIIEKVIREEIEKLKKID